MQTLHDGTVSTPTIQRLRRNDDQNSTPMNDPMARSPVFIVTRNREVRNELKSILDHIVGKNYVDFLISVSLNFFPLIVIAAFRFV